jgi:4-aminobutyrate---pyruvate transaminase
MISKNAKKDIEHIIHPFTDLDLHAEVGPLILERGEGVHVFDEDGNRYLDCMSALWCTSLGYSQDRLINAAHQQMKKMPFYHIFANKSHPPIIELSERLTEIAPHSARYGPMKKFFFANSGSEANDTAVKLIWFYNNALGRPKKKKIIARINGYHGTTIAAGSLTGLPSVHAHFDLPIGNILHTDCPHHYRFAKEGESEKDFAIRMIDNLEKQILAEGPETVAAIIMEPIMGAGGVIVPHQAYYDKLKPLLIKYDILFIVDEVITGFGRTGKMFGSELFGLEPDIITAAKGMSSAYQPISAVMLPEEIYSVIKRQTREYHSFAHGFTNSGNPVSAAVSLEALKIYEEQKIVQHVAETSQYFQKRLRSLSDHPLIGEIRGIGFLAAIELVANKNTKESFSFDEMIGTFCMMQAQEKGIIIRAYDDTIVFAPPLIMTTEHLDEAVERFSECLDATLKIVQSKNLLK